MDGFSKEMPKPNSWRAMDRGETVSTRDVEEVRAALRKGGFSWKANQDGSYTIRRDERRVTTGKNPEGRILDLMEKSPDGKTLGVVLNQAKGYTRDVILDALDHMVKKRTLAKKTSVHKYTNKEVVTYTLTRTE